MKNLKMRLYLMVLALIIDGSIGKPKAEADSTENGGPCSSSSQKCDPTKGYRYEINARRTGQASPVVNPYINLAYKLEPVQNITYLRKIDQDNPIIIDCDVTHGGDTIFDYGFEGDSTLTFCEELPDNSWKYVVIEMIHKGLTSNGKCPIETGSYEIRQEVDPIIVTFDSKIPCGDYELYAGLSNKQRDILNVYFSFTIPKDDNCESS